MKKSDALKQQRHTANELQLALINKAKAENRDFTDAETQEFDIRKAEMDALDSQINRALEIEAVEQRAAIASASVVPGGDGEQREKDAMQKLS